MNTNRLSVVMFSALLSHGGGRETWLNNILPELLLLRVFDQIDVYYIADALTDAHPKIGIFNDSQVNFFEIRLPVVSGKLTSVWRIGAFCINVVKHLRRRPSSGHCVVAVGTFYEGAVLALLRVATLQPPMLVAWIRGVWSKEINHRHGLLIKKLICYFEKLFIQSAHRIISNGLDTKVYYESLLGRHVEAIPNALDVKKYAAFSRKAFAEDCKTVSFIGRLSEEKGLRAYLEAIEAYFDDYSLSNLKFDIVGDGPLRELVEQFVSKYAGYPVRFLGPLSNENMLPYLETIDAGVCLTYSKESGGGGVSNGLLELIGSGRLVIAWDSLIYKQVLQSGQAMFVEESNIAALARGFAELNDKPTAMRTKIAKSAEVLEHYSLERHVRHFVNYVENGLSVI